MSHHEHGSRRPRSTSTTTTTTTATTPTQRFVREVQPLGPLCPDIPPGHRTTGRVRSRRSVVRDQPLLYSPACDHRPERCYLLDRVLVEQKKKHVAIILAHPLVPDDNPPLERTSSSSSSGGEETHGSRGREGGGEGEESKTTTTTQEPPPPCWLVRGSRVVVKVVPHRNSTRSARVDNPVEELAAMAMLSSPGHDNVIRLLDYFQDDQYIYMVLPYMKGGDLFTKVANSEDRGLEEWEACAYLEQIAQGLLYMKEHHRLAHGDISLENIMLTNERGITCKIIDTGMCLLVPPPPPPQTTSSLPPLEGGSSSGSSSSTNKGVTYVLPLACRGKPSYLAPEVVKEEVMDPFAADVWSLGICLYTMLTSRPLYSSPGDRSFRMMARGGVSKVLDAYQAFGLHLSPPARDLVCSMLRADPALRPTLEEVLTHPLLTATTRGACVRQVSLTVLPPPSGSGGLCPITTTSSTTSTNPSTDESISSPTATTTTSPSTISSAPITPTAGRLSSSGLPVQ